MRSNSQAAVRDVLTQEGEYWTIAGSRGVFRLKDSKGLRYLSVLLDHPDVDFHVLDLVADGARPAAIRTARDPTLKCDVPGDAGGLLDSKAKSAYRRRLQDLSAEIEEAEAFNDPERAARARAEVDFIGRELAAAVGLSGRNRRAASSSERARVSVTRRIRSALERIAGNDPALACFLGSAVRTGTFCCYRPNPDLESALLSRPSGVLSASGEVADEPVTECLIERERETNLLGDLARRVSAGRGVAVMIEGPAGIGKSALIATVTAAAPSHGLTALIATGGELERKLPFGVVLQLYEPLLRRHASDERGRLFSGAASASAAIFAPERVSQFTDEEAELGVFHGLFWLTLNVADRHAVMIVVDDAHWADGPSARYLVYLARRLGELPAGVCLALRPAESDGASEALRALASLPTTTVLRPKPLSIAATSQLVRAAAGEAGDKTCSRVHESTGGNPFFVKEVAADLANRNDADLATLAKRVPKRIGEAVRQRLGRLPAKARALAHATAVLGQRAELRHAAALADLDHPSAAKAADELVEHAILAHGRPLTFRHPLERTAIYEGLPTGKRSDLHARAARALWDEDRTSDAVAEHLLATDPAADAWVVKVLREAAAEAGRRSACEVAVKYLSRALDEPAPASERAAILLELELAQRRAGLPSSGKRIARSLAAVGAA